MVGEKLCAKEESIASSLVRALVSGSVWYMCLKTENCCLKIFVKIRVGEKVHWNAWNVV